MNDAQEAAASVVRPGQMSGVRTTSALQHLEAVGRRDGRRRGLTILAAILAAVGLAAVTATRSLSLPARWLVVDSRIEPADVIVLLSGNALARARATARLYHQQYAPRIIVNGDDKHDEFFELLTGERLADSELIGRALVHLGVPDEAITRLDGMKSTRDEAAAFREYVSAHPARKAILVTSHLHSRRARWIFRRALSGTGVEISAFEAEQPDVAVDLWWRDPDAALAVLNEYLKFGYYVVHY